MNERNSSTSIKGATPTNTGAKLPERRCRLKLERERHVVNIFIAEGVQIICQELIGDWMALAKSGSDWIHFCHAAPILLANSKSSNFNSFQSGYPGGATSRECRAWGFHCR
jgi:hypothetical protein